jgi:hypothetical protein
MPGATWRDNLNKRVLLDNGAYMIKYGTAATKGDPRTMFNAIGRDKNTKSLYMGNEVLDRLNKGQINLSLTFPLVRGLLHESDIETIIWKEVFNQIYKKKFDAGSSCL